MEQPEPAVVGLQDNDGGESVHTMHTDSQYGENNENEKRRTAEQLKIAKKENRWVWRLRLITALVLTCVALGICLATYLQGSKAEQDDLEQDFSDLGEKLVSSFEDVVSQRFGIVQKFAEEVSIDANGTWPYVTTPGYTYRARSVTELTHVFMLTMLTKIEDRNELEQWENYSVTHQDWIREGVAIMENVPEEDITDVSPISPKVLNVHYGGPPKPDDGDGPFFPIWTMFPPRRMIPFININMYNDPEHKASFNHAMKGKAAFEKCYDYIGVAEEEKVNDMRYQGLTNNMYFDYFDDPFAVTVFPIFNTVSTVEEDQDRKKVVALLIQSVYWREYFDDLLPPGADGILVILENSCQQQYTYRVDGRSARFVGHGDLHDPKYDYLGTGTSIESIIDSDTLKNAPATTSSNSSNPNSEFPENCEYGIRVYPSQDFEDSHLTRKPLMYSLIIGTLFILTSMVFLLYDYVVERRQHAVMRSAQQSGAIVQSLFPEEVRNRLYEEQEEARKEKEKKELWESTAKEAIGEGVSNKAAIANVYPETTIFFADLAGFTKWSSSRTPAQVFQLLETLYCEFDKIAERYHVFKVETIGDCYVAITGLPDPQPDHARRMVRFSIGCLSKMSQLTGSLIDSLGADTADLELRIGLHSGSVTAGVLRGQKSRFQLFGDAVNTASRMESNGVKGRIHISQFTADELIKAGKQNWLLPREGAIEVKGKGSMQTYFIRDEVIDGVAKSVGTSVRSGFDLINDDDDDIDGNHNN